MDKKSRRTTNVRNNEFLIRSYVIQFFYKRIRNRHIFGFKYFVVQIYRDSPHHLYSLIGYGRRLLTFYERKIQTIIVFSTVYYYGFVDRRIPIWVTRTYETQTLRYGSQRVYTHTHEERADDDVYIAHVKKHNLYIRIYIGHKKRR